MMNEPTTVQRLVDQINHLPTFSAMEPGVLQSNCEVHEELYVKLSDIQRCVASICHITGIPDLPAPPPGMFEWNVK